MGVDEEDLQYNAVQYSTLVSKCHRTIPQYIIMSYSVVVNKNVIKQWNILGLQH